MANSFVSPGVYAKELDFSLYVSRLSTSIFGVVGTATKGEVNTLSLYSDVSGLETTYGFPSPSVAVDADTVRIGGTQGVYQAGQYLKNGSLLYFVRVAGDNLAYASLDITNVGTYYGGYAGAETVLSITAITPGTWYNDNVGVRITHVDATTYDLDVYEQGSKVETYPSVTQATVASRVNGVSTRITLIVDDDTQIPGETLDPITARQLTATLDGGDDGVYAKTQGTVSYPNIKDAVLNDTLRIVAIREGVLCNVNATPSSGFSVKLDETDVGLVTYLRIGAYYNGTLIAGEEFLATTKALLITEVNNSSNFFNLESITTGLEPNAAVSTYFYLSGAFTTSDVIGSQSGNTLTGLQLFRNTEYVDVNLIAAPGQFHRQVLDELADIASSRGDALALLATPFDLTVAEIVSWANGSMTPEAEVPYPPISSLNTSYATLMYQWVRTYDSVNDVSVWTSSEGAHASAMALTDNAADPWFAPAGLTRGKLTFIEDITYSPSQGEREILYGNTGSVQNAINPWVNFRGQGIAIWGQRTLQRASTSLDRINVRRLMNALKKTIATSTQYLVFDPNDPTLWNQWEMLIRPYMKSVQARRGLAAWKVQMDSTTTTALDIDQNRAVGRIFVQPTKTAEIISLQFILTPTGVSFEEILGGSSL